MTMPQLATSYNGICHDRIATLEQKVDFFVQTKEPPLQSIFYQNKFWDAKSLLIKFIRRAKKELIVIDAYPGVATLDMLAKRGRGVKIELAKKYLRRAG